MTDDRPDVDGMNDTAPVMRRRARTVAAQVFHGLAVLFMAAGALVLVPASVIVIVDSFGEHPVAVGPITLFAYILIGAACVAPAMLASAIARYLAKIGHGVFRLALWTWPVPAVALLVSGALRVDLLSIVALAGVVAVAYFARRRMRRR